jgi:hypothetical protein
MGSTGGETSITAQITGSFVTTASTACTLSFTVARQSGTGTATVNSNADGRFYNINYWWIPD